MNDVQATTLAILQQILAPIIGFGLIDNSQAGLIITGVSGLVSLGLLGYAAVHKIVSTPGGFLHRVQVSGSVASSISGQVAHDVSAVEASVGGLIQHTGTVAQVKAPARARNTGTKAAAAPANKS